MKVAHSVGTRSEEACVHSDNSELVHLAHWTKTFETKKGMSVFKFLRLRNIYIYIYIYKSTNHGVYINDLFHK